MWDFSPLRHGEHGESIETQNRKKETKKESRKAGEGRNDKKWFRFMGYVMNCLCRTAVIPAHFESGSSGS
jgi:hypothetical protein